MRGQFWLIGAVLATIIANTGCVSDCHKTYQTAWERGAGCELPTPCRSRVYVFMLHGVTPSTDCGLETLRMKLAEGGFAKVATGELVHAWWVASEIKDIRKCDPEARFVLIGYDLGCAAAVPLARDLVAKGVPVDAVVLLDPVGPMPAQGCGVHTLLFASGASTTTAPHTGRVIVPDASHFGLPTHPTTVAVVTALLKDIAARNCHPTIESVPAWDYKYAPEMRPEVTVQKPGGEWDFLSDQPGVPLPIGTIAVERQPVMTAAPVAAKR